jgi:hypothetical protein
MLLSNGLEFFQIFSAVSTYRSHQDKEELELELRLPGVSKRLKKRMISMVGTPVVTTDCFHADNIRSTIDEDGVSVMRKTRIMRNVVENGSVITLKKEETKLDDVHIGPETCERRRKKRWSLPFRGRFSGAEFRMDLTELNDGQWWEAELELVRDDGTVEEIVNDFLAAVEYFV